MGLNLEQHKFVDSLELLAEGIDIRTKAQGRD